MRWYIAIMWGLALLCACDDGDPVGSTADLGRPLDAQTDQSPAPDRALPTCEADARRCGAAGVEVCAAGAWAPLAPCPAGTACADGICEALPCEPA